MRTSLLWTCRTTHDLRRSKSRPLPSTDATLSALARSLLNPQNKPRRKTRVPRNYSLMFCELYHKNMNMSIDRPCQYKHPSLGIFEVLLWHRICPALIVNISMTQVCPTWNGAQVVAQSFYTISAAGFLVDGV